MFPSIQSGQVSRLWRDETQADNWGKTVQIGKNCRGLRTLKYCCLDPSQDLISLAWHQNFPKHSGDSHMQARQRPAGAEVGRGPREASAKTWAFPKQGKQNKGQRGLGGERAGAEMQWETAGTEAWGPSPGQQAATAS